MRRQRGSGEAAAANTAANYGRRSASSALRLFDAVDQTAIKVGGIISQRIEETIESGAVLFQQRVDQDAVGVDGKRGAVVQDARRLFVVQHATVDQIRQHVRRPQMTQNHVVDLLRFEDLLFVRRHAEKLARV